MNDGLPGVEFSLISSNIRQANVTKKRYATVTLEAQIHDDPIWEAVLAKFQSGLKIYSVEDFKTEILNALRKENERLEACNKSLDNALRNAVTENQQMKAALGVLGRQLGE